MPKAIIYLLILVMTFCALNLNGQYIPFAFFNTRVTKGFFVFVDTDRSANMGGLAGANSWCLSMLTSQAWLGKQDALLDSAHVFAFLCDATTCNQLIASKQYFFARAGSATTGGDSFTTDASGLGPGATGAWDSATKFGSTSSTFVYWTGRSAGTSTIWGATPHANTCTSWSTASSGVSGRYGDTGTSNANRWSNNATSCDTPEKLICFVNPSPH